MALRVKMATQLGQKAPTWRALLVEGNPTELVDIIPLTPVDYEAERNRFLSLAELMELHKKRC